MSEQNTELMVDAQQAKSVATTFLDPVVWEQIKGVAKTFYESKAIPKYIENAPQLVMVLQAGLELGLKPVEAMGALYIVNGTLNLWGKAVPRQLRKHGFRIKYEELTRKIKVNNEDVEDTGCRATVTRETRNGLGNVMDKEEYSEEAWYSDAEASGYTKTSTGIKPGWKAGQSRKLKLRYMALSAICKTYIPEVLGSASDIAEIAEDFTENNTIQGEVVSTTGPDKPIKPTINNGSLKDFLDKNKGKKNGETTKVQVDMKFNEADDADGGVSAEVKEVEEGKSNE